MSVASSTDPEDVLSVSIPLQGRQRPLLGGTLTLPCFFEVCGCELSLSFKYLYAEYCNLQFIQYVQFRNHYMCRHLI